jgi:hypothetical protein
MIKRAIVREKTAKDTFPIIVDKDGLIVLGHERYYALEEMGKEIDYKVYDLPEKVADKYRIVDCRISMQNPNVRLKPFYQELTNNYKEYVPRKNTKGKSKS